MSLYTKHRLERCKGCGSKGPEERLNSRWWLPGIVVVEFEKPLPPTEIFAFTASTSKQGLSWLDLGRLRQIVGGLSVKPPEWTFSFEPHQLPSKPNYEHFITVYLRPEVNVPEIAKDLSDVRGVLRADGEPILLPPIRRIRSSASISHALSETLSEVPILNEPLAVSGGQAFGLAASVSIGSESFQNQWYLFRSKADGLITSGKSGAGVVVADVDWGFNVEHQEFGNNKIKFKYNAAKDNDIVSFGPMKWHGTATLGLIGAGDNDTGMLGFAAGADLWAIQGQDEGVNIDNRNWARAIEKARTHPSGGKRKVILVEASTDRSFNVESSTTVRESIKAAIEDNCVVCVAAGNRGVNAGIAENGQAIPESGSILVGATQYRDDPSVIRRGISNWGPRVVVSAPGEPTNDVTCCDCGTHTYTDDFGGTSGAAAKVAGAMALVLQAFPEVTHQQIVDVLKTKMPPIPVTTQKKIGTFLDVSELITQVTLL